MRRRISFSCVHSLPPVSRPPSSSPAPSPQPLAPLYSPAPRPPSPVPPSGITLIEILISLFVLLFGLMGVAAIFPVASHYLVQGDQKDRSDQLANNAFAEIEARGMLNARKWSYMTQNVDGGSGFPVMSPLPPAIFRFGPQQFGNAFVIDPLVGPVPGAAPESPSEAEQRKFFPRLSVVSPPNPWSNLVIAMGTGNALVTEWPVKRVTFSDDPNTFGSTVMRQSTAETIFRLRDDLAVEQPDQGDRPAMQRWSVDNATGTLLARQYVGDYSWLATVVPADSNALLGLQPAANLAGGLYDVSVVVFYKRDIVPSVTISGSPGSERLIAAEFLNQGELAVYDFPNNDPDAVDLAVEGIRPTNWICVMGVNQTNGQFLLRWYRILAMDEDTEDLGFAPAGLTGGNALGRLMMVSEGGDWPTNSMQNLRVAILPGAIHVKTRQLPLSCECCE